MMSEKIVMRIKILVASILLLIVFTSPVDAASNSNINILLNGKAVSFTNDSGYPFVDENNRTMVPLRATMEAAGFVVGYDMTEKTAIVITENRRIEVPIGTNLIYTNNQLTENDTNAVVKNNRTYLPIRAVLENAGYTVEWDSKTRTVNAYTFSFDTNSFTPYSTSSLSTLATNVLNGNVVYINGQYYATPDYVKRMSNVQVHYDDPDLNVARYPEAGRTDFADDVIEWIEVHRFGYVLVSDYQLREYGIVGEPSERNGYEYVYAFYEDGLYGTYLRYPVDEMTAEFMGATNATGTFNGIRMKKEDGTLYFYQSDLIDKDIDLW